MKVPDINPIFYFINIMLLYQKIKSSIPQPLAQGLDFDKIENILKSGKTDMVLDY